MNTQQPPPADTRDTVPAAYRVDITRPHSARFWNYFVGGRDNYEVDRAIGDQIKAFFPGLVDVAVAGRQFLRRSVTHLVQERGVRQFLDIGTGLPSADNTHQVAQSLAPESRIVYVDNDPLVLTHARALLSSTHEGATDYIDADLYDPAAILAAAGDTLDFDRPVALMLLGILGHADDFGRARDVVRELMAGLPSGSYLAVYDGTRTSEGMIAAEKAYIESGAVPYHVREPDEIVTLFDGLRMLDPGFVRLSEWWPDADSAQVPADVDAYGGVGMKE
ncbi:MULTISPECIES: SAM-dependent methyltransferase [Streptomyces]|uniref:SAM-dependent methyltransferase n=2 Tax=Streptomyces TaxID=1883 RepID=A0ABU2RD79_9ACTN|nr:MULTISPECIES: SAM-dependent methyltransferase [unclassified Streptomyces]MBK3595078.1 SAM-dependent methyltransferase [Streptomyces sp. MBT51]MDT0426826.1 SAM-dependent methyltransferase [Streptomyces sp. DSM 41770]